VGGGGGEEGGKVRDGVLADKIKKKERVGKGKY
jgi:hypothetical protein